MMHRGMRPRWRCCRLALLVALAALPHASTALAAEADDAASELAGVPDTIIGLIYDTTSLYAERPFFTDPDVAPVATHVIHQAKEMPWRHGYLRRRQRRLYPVALHAAAPTAQAEAEGGSAGRLRYRLSLSGAGEASHGSVAARGLAATDDFSQGRGSRTETSLAARAGVRGERGNADLRASWSLNSLNWRSANGALTARDRTLIDAFVVARLGASERRGRTRLSVRGVAYRLAPPSSTADHEDTISQARVAAEIDVDRAGRPMTLAARGVVRRTEASGVDGVTNTTLATVSLADKYAAGPLGVADWRVSLAAYANPPASPDLDSSPEIAVPFAVGWTTSVGPVSVRLHGGYGVDLAAISLYADADHVAVNPTLPARTAWQGGASVWARVGPSLLSGSVDAEDVEGLPVWQETDVLDDDGSAIAWRPVAVEARLLSWRLRLAVPRGAHATFAVTVAGETTDPADPSALHLPYRPALTATAEARLAAPGDARVRLTAQHVGRRYRSPSDAEGMDGYSRVSVRVARALTSALDVFVTAEGSAGTYQVFESSRDAEWRALSQGGVGVGFTGRI